MSEFFIAVKAVGDMELDVLAIPFGSRDSDGQWFDERTDISHETFTTPLIVYQHGVKQGAKELDEKPQVIGKVIPGTLRKDVDGWHLRVRLDSALKIAHEIMAAAWKRLVAVSSGSIAHLARLDVNGKVMQYEKNRPGRIVSWPLAEVSLWELGNGNNMPASNMAMALPAMKAMYREAGIPFPDVKDASGGAEADKVKHRARVEAEKKKAKELIKQIGDLK